MNRILYYIMFFLIVSSCKKEVNVKETPSLFSHDNIISISYSMKGKWYSIDQEKWGDILECFREYERYSLPVAPPGKEYYLGGVEFYLQFKYSNGKTMTLAIYDCPELFSDIETEKFYSCNNENKNTLLNIIKLLKESNSKL